MAVRLKVPAGVDPKKLAHIARAQTLLQQLRAKAEMAKRGYYDAAGVRQGGLIAFIRQFWSVLEPEQPFVDGWPLWAMCEHLEAVSFGDITRLLINVPPGFMKSLMTDCFWPAWEWGPLNKAHLRYVAFSYSASLTERDNDRFRMLVSSPAYQRLYGPFKTRRAKVKEDLEDTFVGKTGGVGLRNKTITKVMNTRSGWKLASSVGGVGTGERGDRIIIDDPHNVIEAESEIVRAETVRWFRESISSRFNNLDTGALVLIMQRVHYDDVSGVALSDDFDYCQFIVPWSFDPSRWIRGNQVIKNAIGWVDPRLDADDWYKNDGQPAWPERFSEDAIARLKAEIGPYGFSSQYQQSPVSRGEAIFKREYWKLWESPDDKFPPFDLIIGSLDGAFTEKEENDPSAMTVWGVWTEETSGFVDERDTGIRHNYAVKSKRLMLIRAWRKHLQFSSKRIDPYHYDTDASYRQRTSQHWGLIEWVRDTCVRYKVDKLLIEAKASGISAAQEIQNRYGLQDFGIQLCPVKGDKVARALAVQPTFSQGLVYAPDLDWADMVIEEMEMFPKGKYDDLTDSTTQALKYLRDAGMAQTFEEERHGIVDHVTHRKVRRGRLYPV